MQRYPRPRARMMAAALTLGCLTSWWTPPEAEAAETLRIEGADRYATAVAVSGLQGYRNGSGFRRVAIASGENFPDALVAATMGMPVLLVGRDAVPDVVADELRRLRPSSIVVVGGTAAVSETLAERVKQLVGNAELVRYGGANRYETAAAVASSIHFFFFDGEEAPHVMVASGEDFPDALSATQLSQSLPPYGGRVPILLIRRGQLPEETVRHLVNHVPSQVSPHITVIGGENAVSDGVATQLSTVWDEVQMHRIAGADRYETAAAMARLRWDQDGAVPSRAVVLATGEDFPDALVASWLAERFQAPLLLTQSRCKPRAIAEVEARFSSQVRLVVGGADVAYAGTRVC